MKKNNINKTLNLYTSVQIENFSKNNIYKFVSITENKEILFYLNQYDMDFLIYFRYDVDELYKDKDYYNSIVQYMLSNNNQLIIFKHEFININVYKLNHNDYLRI